MPRTVGTLRNGSVIVGTRLETFQCGVVRKHLEHFRVIGLELSRRMWKAGIL